MTQNRVSTLLAERVKKLKDDYKLQGYGGW